MSAIAFHPDSADGDQTDLLDIGMDVDAMAALVATRDIQPPLSIGLFGDWGSGKTFFMEKMHARVERMAQESASERLCQGVVQIRFNAWHYVDANLWASLIDTIFRRLEEAVRGGEDGEARLGTLRERLRRAATRQQEVERELDQIEERLAAARDDRDRVAREKQQAEANAQGLRVAGMPTIGETVREQIERLLREVRDNVGIQGLPEAQAATDATIEEAVRLLSDARLLRSRGSHLWQAIVHSGLTWRHWVILGLGLLVPVAVTAGIAWLNESSILDWLSQPLLVLTELAVMIGTGVKWARGKLRQASDVLDRIDALRDTLTVERDVEMDRRAQALERAEREIARLGEELDRKQGNLESIMTEAAEVRRQLEEMAPIRRMARFLSERASSDDYRKHLGLVALIRQDLEELSRLLALQDGAKRDADLPAVDRIVLYIDDLDRCPPQRVVEMLQAVHLLLAFPLFVVVVAVDVRWVARSLAEHYPVLLDDAHPGQDARNTSHDYLEKIFQVPFWIRPLTPATSAAMLAGLLDERARPAPPEPTGKIALQTKAAGPPAPEPEAAGSHPLARAVVTDAGRAPETGGPEAGGPTTVTNGVPAASRDSRSGGTHDVPSPTRPPLEPTARAGHAIHSLAGAPGSIDPERLRIRPRERALMITLSSGVGRSPRELKRFVNIYRLLKASLADSERQAFEPDPRGRGAYAPTLLALAILVGYPRLAAALFDALMDSNADPGAGACEDSTPATWLADREAHLTALDEHDADQDWAALSSMVRTFCRVHPVSLADLRACVPRVARYSFRSF